MGSSWKMGLWVYGIGNDRITPPGHPFYIGPATRCTMRRVGDTAYSCYLDSASSVAGAPFIILPDEDDPTYRWGVYPDPDFGQFPWFTDARPCTAFPPPPYPDLPHDGIFRRE